jgi:hypothetical protein
MRWGIVLLGWLCVAGAAGAGEYDGLWKPAPIQVPDGNEIDQYTCDPQVEAGAIPIEGDWYGDPESNCTMSNPTAVRGMEATLFDVTCQGDWGSRTQRELLMLFRDENDEERLLMVTPYGASEYERCK